MGDGLIAHNNDSNKQLSQKIGEVVITDNSGSNSAENKSKSRSSYKRKVNHDKRAALMQNHLTSQSSYILQDEVA